MVLPLAAAIAPELISMMKGQGGPQGSQSGTIISFTWMPTIKIGKGKEKKYIPDPAFPDGFKIQVPAWFFILGILIGPVLLMGILLYFLEVFTRFSASKEKDPIKRLVRAAVEPFSGLGELVKGDKGYFGLGILQSK